MARWRRGRAALVPSAVGAAVLLVSGTAWATGPGEPSPQARGLSFAGLVRALAGPCAGGYEVDVPGLGPVCTHGPDAVPVGVSADVGVATTTTASAADATSAATVPCIGDGRSGKRVQMVYATASDVVDDYASVLPSLVGYAAAVEQAVVDSAAVTGGVRHVRFVTNPDCTLDVAHVVLPPTGDDTFGATITELRAQGYSSNDRKYVVWTNARVYCGIAQAFSDSTAGATNLSNTTAGYARIDRGCWGQSGHLVELHELVHVLGGVQPTAPHGTAAFHCTDESDAMCYSDAAGVVMTYPCPTASEALLDCGNDDYFSTAPPAGSYLATHWNVADSAFLAASLTESAPAPAPSPVTDTVTGSTTTRSGVRTHPLTTGSGPVTATVTFSPTGKVRTAPAMTVRILTADKSVLAAATGTSPVRIQTTLAAGSYRVELSTAAAVSYTLTVTHPAA